MSNTITINPVSNIEGHAKGRRTAFWSVLIGVLAWVVVLGVIRVGAAEVAADTDGDGFTDAQEWAWNTDPQVASSHPDLSRQLVGWWSLTEGSGQAARDATGLGRTGVVQAAGSPVWEAAEVGKGLRLAGGTDRVEVAPAAGVPLTNGVSVVAWVKLARASEGVVVRQRGAAAGAATFELAVVAGKLVGRLWLAEVEYPLFGRAVVADEQWHHVGLAYDGQVWRLVVDGRGDVETDLWGELAVAAGPLVIGPVQGVVREVGVYGRCLAGAELQLLYEVASVAEGSSGRKPPAGLTFFVGQSRAGSAELNPVVGQSTTEVQP